MGDTRRDSSRQARPGARGAGRTARPVAGRARSSAGPASRQPQAPPPDEQRPPRPARPAAEISSSIRRGVVSLPQGWDLPDVNRLTSDGENLDLITGMPRFSGIPVIVEALSDRPV